MYVRTTTASRRFMQRMLDLSRMIHVSQAFDPHTVQHTDEAGVVTEEVIFKPRFMDVLGKKAKGQTYVIGRNQRKRVCRRGHINHTHAERHFGVRPGKRKNWYAACMGA